MTEEITSDYCESQEVSYSVRVYNEDEHNFCVVPDSAYDAILFAAIGIIFTCLAPRKHYAILMLIFGAITEILNIYVNTRELSNSYTIWIGMQPAELFFYIFLPPLLLDSAVRIDFFIFKKVMPAVFTFAFLVVAANTIILAAFLMLGINLQKSGWTWTDAFLFACMIASTDAVAVTAIMKQGGGPENLIVLVEGESLFNDATSIVFFDLFWPRFKEALSGELEDEPLSKLIWSMALEVLWLAVGGAIVGLVSGIITSYIFKILQTRSGHSPVAEVGMTVGVSYLCFYLANAVIGVSGVIAVVVYGLYGASTTQWDMSPKAREANVFEGFWDVTQLLVNGVVFFYAGASATNFFIRDAQDLFEDDIFNGILTIFGLLPVIYIAIFLFRFLELFLFSPLLALMGSKLRINEIIFICFAGLRGALALILAQTLLQYHFPEDAQDLETKALVRAQSALWTCGFVMLTLLINAPAIPWLLKVCGLEHVSVIKEQSKIKAHQALVQYTHSTIDHFKEDRFNMLRGVNWKKLERFILDSDVNESKGHGGGLTSINSSLSYSASWKKEDHLGKTKWNLITSILSEQQSTNSVNQLQQQQQQEPLISKSQNSEGEETTEKILKDMDTRYQQADFHTEDAPFAGSYTNKAAFLETEDYRMYRPSISDLTDEHAQAVIRSNMTGICVITDSWNNSFTNKMLAMSSKSHKKQKNKPKIIIELKDELPKEFERFSAFSTLWQQDTVGGRFENVTVFNLHRANSVLPQIWREHMKDETESALLLKRMPTEKQKSESMADNVDVSLPFLEHQEIDDVEDYEEQVLAEARFRMLAGLKKYFHERRTQGFLSGQALRLLHWACDIAMENSSVKLEIWENITSEINNKWSLKLQSRIRYYLRNSTIIIRNWNTFIRTPLLLIINSLSKLMSWSLSKELHMSVEVAIEYWLALLVYRSHSTWLVEPGRAGDLVEELKKQAELVWKFIIDREIEGPERFAAIQTYRAIRAIIKQQVSYVDQLSDVGLLDETEHESMKDHLDEKLTKLDRKGGVRLGPDSILEFCRNIPFLTNISDEIYKQIIAKCQLCLFEHGEQIYSRGENDRSRSIHIVINGILRTDYKDKTGNFHEYYIGKGGIFGLLYALTGTVTGSMDKAYAGLNALGQGPSVLTIPEAVLTDIKIRAAEGQLEYQQIELDMLRLAALYVFEFMQAELVQVLTGFYMDKTMKDEDTNNSSTQEDGSVVTFADDAIEKVPIHVKLVSNESSSHNDTSNYKSSYPTKLLTECHHKALSFIKKFKIGLLSGELVLLPAHSEIIMSSSFVLLKGSITSYEPPNIKVENNSSIFTQKIKFKAPTISPWVFSSQVEASEQKGVFWSGNSGAVLVRCATPFVPTREELESLMSKNKRDGTSDLARISGKNLHPMVSAERTLSGIIGSNN